MSRVADAGLALAVVVVLAFAAFVYVDHPSASDEATDPSPSVSDAPTPSSTPTEATSETTEDPDPFDGPADVLVLGDDVAAADGATRRWTKGLSEVLDVRLDNRSRLGAGYVTDGPAETCDIRNCPSMSSMARLAISQDAQADVILVVGGVADAGIADETDVADFYQGLRATFPLALIFAVGPLVIDGEEPEGLAELDDAVRAEVARVGGSYLDVGQPYADAADLDLPERLDAGGEVVGAAVIDALEPGFAR